MRNPFAIVRKDERKTVSRFASKEGVKYGYSYESLGFEKKNRHMEPFIVTLEPATIKTSKTSTHEGEEFIFVLEGEMEVIFGNHTDVLYPGDSHLLRFDHSPSGPVSPGKRDENFGRALYHQYLKSHCEIDLARASMQISVAENSHLTLSGIFE